MIFNLNSSFLSRYILLSVCFFLWRLSCLTLDNLNYFLYLVFNANSGDMVLLCYKKILSDLWADFPIFIYPILKLSDRNFFWNSKHNKVFKFSFWHLWLGLFIGFAICKDNSSILLSELALLYFQACYAFFLLSSVIRKLR